MPRRNQPTTGRYLPRGRRRPATVADRGATAVVTPVSSTASRTEDQTELATLPFEPVKWARVLSGEISANPKGAADYAGHYVKPECAKHSMTCGDVVLVCAQQHIQLCVFMTGNMWYPVNPVVPWDNGWQKILQVPASRLMAMSRGARALWAAQQTQIELQALPEDSPDLTMAVDMQHRCTSFMQSLHRRPDVVAQEAIMTEFENWAQVTGALHGITAADVSILVGTSLTGTLDSNRSNATSIVNVHRGLRGISLLEQENQ